jgi:phenylacetate-CoA ligase
LALLCDGVGKHGITFRAIFSQGENLPDGQRRFISRVFSAPVYDSYGHMERTAAISQCPHGTYHIHSDFGLVELVEPRNQVELPMSLAPGQAVREVVGTSLHNLSMPLIRYRTGDLVLVDCGCPPCPCGRSFPMVRAILGRDTDIVTTSDGRAITALYAAMDRVAGIRCSQIIQESADTLLVRIACDGPAKPALRQSVERTIQSFTGTSTRVVVHECESEEIYARRERKFKSVVSHVPPLSVTP